MTYALILILPVAFYYLGSRAVITRWLWSRYPARFARFMDCAACSGFWYGAAVAAGLKIPWENLFIAGLVTLVTTPIGAAIMQHALELLGTAVPEAD